MRCHTEQQYGDSVPAAATIYTAPKPALSWRTLTYATHPCTVGSPVQAAAGTAISALGLLLLDSAASKNDTA